MRRFLLLTALLTIITATHTPVSAQTIVGFSRNGSISAATAKARTAQIWGSKVPAPNRAIELYKIRYTSRDPKNRSVVLSGLVAWPQGGASKGLVIYNHGTIADRGASPSRYKGAANRSENELSVLAFASGGYAVALPDYIGLGDHTGAHPFPQGKVNSQSAVDIVAPALSLAVQRGVRVGPKIYVTGYSEGGGVAMWMARKLDQMPNMRTRFAASAPLSGPYDLSGVTRQSLLGTAPTATQFATRLYLLAYSLHSLHKSGGGPLVNFFKPTMANAVLRAFNGNLSDAQIIQRLAVTGTLMGARNSLERVVTPRFLQAMKSRDLNHPFVRMLAQNDCYNWTPRTKMLLVTLQNDTVVTSANTRRALQAMRARGVSSNTVRDFIIRDNRLNHVTAIPSALLHARQFFDGGFSSVQ